MVLSTLSGLENSNAVFKFRMNGLVTFKLFANTYVKNACILYALFSIVGLDANFD